MSEYYRYLKYLKYINGVPQDEYKQGDLIGVVEADSLSDCEQGVEYRWVEVPNEYYCDGYVKYAKERKQAYRNGVWENTSEYRKGLVLDLWSTDCGVEWQYRWESTGKTACNGYQLTTQEVHLVSKDMGNTWLNVEPVEYRETVTDEFNKDCVLATEPLTFEVPNVEKDQEVSIDLVVTNVKGEGSDLFVEWEDNIPLISYKIGSGSKNTISHYYEESPGTKIIKLWGVVSNLYDLSLPYKIISWGTKYKYFDYSGNRSNLAYIYLIRANLLDWVDDVNKVLAYNKLFIVTNNDNITKLPVSDFIYTQTEYLNVSECHNLLYIPTLLDELYIGNPPENYRNFKTVSAENCTSLKESPKGLWMSYPINYPIRDRFTCSFKGCTSLTKINGPIYIINGEESFMGCTSLVDIPDEMYVINSNSMFKDCTSLEKCPKLIYAYSIFDKNIENVDVIDRSYMFANTKIRSANIDFINEGESDAMLYEKNESRYSYMFFNCKYLTEVTGELIPLRSENYESYHNNILANNMFEGCSNLTTISSIFKGAKFAINCNYMFKDCNITTIPNDFFNYNAKYQPNFKEVFSGNLNLTNYPIYNDYPIWYWYSFYLGAKISTTYAFANCPLIAPEVPMEWGGLKDSSLLPMTLSFTGKGNYSPYETSAPKLLVIDWGDGSLNSYPSISEELKSHYYKTDEKHTITIYIHKDSVFYIAPNKLTDIEDFGTVEFEFESNGVNINSLGATHGLFKEATSFRLSESKNLTKIDPNFFTDCLNMTTLYIGINMSKLDFKPFKDYLPNLESLDIISFNTSDANYDEAFEGFSLLIRCHVANGELISGYTPVSAKRTFKDCPKLVSGSVYLSDPADECYMNCISLTSGGLSMENNLQSAVRTYCNTGVTSCTFMPLYTTYNIVHGDCNYTEMYKDCIKLTTIESDFLHQEYGFFLDGTLNLTRCFENCTALTKTPVIRVANGNTYKLWEVAGIKLGGSYVLAKNIIGTECFKGCTQLEDYDEIPSDWK